MIDCVGVLGSGGSAMGGGLCGLPGRDGFASPLVVGLGAFAEGA